MVHIVKIPLVKKDLVDIKKRYESTLLTESNKMLTKMSFKWANSDLKYVSCWNCAYELLAHKCIGIPTSIQNQHFVCYGYFCSFECAVRFICDTLFVTNPTEYYNQYSLLCIAYQKLNTDQKITNCAIEKAPPRFVLQRFGGIVSYDEYHRNNRTTKIDFYRLPLVPLDIYIMNMSSINPELVNTYKHSLSSDVLAQSYQDIPHPSI